MRIRTAFPLYFSLFLIVGPIACVTVNVNFPENTVQKATDDYVKELYEKKRSSDGAFLTLGWGSLAYAETLEFKVFTKKSRAIQKKLKKKLKEVDRYKANSVIGETSDGLLKVRKSVKGMEGKRIKKLVASVNRDRKELYEEIMDANDLPDSKLKGLQSSFARSFQSMSPSKTWVQSEGGQWSQKP